MQNMLIKYAGNYRAKLQECGLVVGTIHNMRGVTRAVTMSKAFSIGLINKFNDIHVHYYTWIKILIVYTRCIDQKANI